MTNAIFVIIAALVGLSYWLLFVLPRRAESRKAAYRPHGRGRGRIKRQVALWLRQLAHRIHPEYLKSVEIEWKRDMPPWVDIQFRGHRQRVSGYVDTWTAK